jgi:hypothetical protein
VFIGFRDSTSFGDFGVMGGFEKDFVASKGSN